MGERILVLRNGAGVRASAIETISRDIDLVCVDLLSGRTLSERCNTIDDACAYLRELVGAWQQAEVDDV